MTTDNAQPERDASTALATEAASEADVTSVERVWLDGTKDGGDVRDLVESLLGRTDPLESTQKQPTRRRRSGLGRGLGDLIPNDDKVSDLTPLQPSAEKRPTIVSLAVVEAAGGLSIEIEDGAGAIHTGRVVEEASSDRAVVEVVRVMVNESDDANVRITDVETDEGSIVMAIAVSGDDRAVGSAFVGFGRPFAVARAVLSALSELQSERSV